MYNFKKYEGKNRNYINSFSNKYNRIINFGWNFNPNVNRR